MSVHSDHVADIYNVPMSVIKRLLPSELDEDKVDSLIESMKV